MKKIFGYLFLLLFSIESFSQGKYVINDTALSKSITYLNSKNGKIDPIYLDIFLNYFEKRFQIDLNVDLNYLKTEFDKISYYEDSGPLYARLIGYPPIFITEKMIDSVHQPYDSIMLRALYADQLQLKLGVYRKLFKIRYKDKAPYSISHSLIALAWLKELNIYAKFTNKKILKFSKKGIFYLNNNKCQYLDEFCELSAIMAYHKIGAENYINWKTTILSLQNEDGSWGNDLKNKSFNNDHCSIMATWFLLEQNFMDENHELMWIKLTK